MSSGKHIQQVLRDILWKPEAIAGATPQQGKDVAGGRGSYWYGDGSSSDNDKEPPPKDKGKGGDGGKDGKDGKDGGGGKDGKDGKGGGDDDKGKGGGFDPSKPPENGDDAGVIEPLYDCGSGQCVDVVLNPEMVKTPQGWENPCGKDTDGDGKADKLPKGYFSYSANIFVRRQGQWVKEKETSGVTLVGGEAYAEVEAIIGGHPLSARMLEQVADVVRRRGGSYSTGGHLTSSGPAGEGHYMGNASIAWHSCDDYWHRGKKICTEPQPITLPKGDCMQVVSDGDGFRPFCDYKDLPAHLAGGDYSSFTLCDKNGNPVTISRDGQGWKIDHPDYTATVGADFKISHVVKKPKL
ncbi:hypothetical protein [Conchiformibius steedae]|uniref:hypothetical protein n=1 Tax=Conchiformibius steedae TaxID=153493 RepID=UPI0026EED157|nr:hypothetical protein [Conchiformibius steedae]